MNRRETPRIAVFNDGAPTLSTIAKWCEIHGYGVVTAQLAHMRVAHVDVERFVTTHRSDVIIYDVAMPYESNWDFLDVIRTLPALAGIPIVVTTSNKLALEDLVVPTNSLEAAFFLTYRCFFERPRKENTSCARTRPS